ncbi:MAG: hypothetical protein HFF26_06340 [Oscillospiraceae bacterium]|nr:hypothetical protein [Oscillospiraceae bacterium]
MKKVISVLLCVMMFMSLLPPAFAVPYVDDGRHSCEEDADYTVYLGDKVEETCTTETYNYTKYCNRCKKRLKAEE